MSEHKHEHGDNCSCGEHTEHKHNGHTHAEHVRKGHEHYSREHRRHGHNAHDRKGHKRIGHKHHGSTEKSLRFKLKPRKTSGVVYIERHIHDEAIVVSGSLTVITELPDLSGCIAEELENAAREVNRLDGIVGHIKASASISTSGIISVTDEVASIKKSPERIVKITLAAIVFLVEPEQAEQIVRKALRGIRERAKHKEKH